MGKRQGKPNSNRREICPACGQEFGNRAAAVSHYRKHVAAGELHGAEYGFNGKPSAFSLDERVWWSRGAPHYMTMEKYLWQLADDQWRGIGPLAYLRKRGA